jgi:adenylate kinase
MSTLVGLTGTPGTGKSAAVARLDGRLDSVEIDALAVRLGAGRRTRRGYTLVDLARLRRRLHVALSDPMPRLLVGHLAHLLPVRDVIVLRCHPVVLAQRLDRAHRGSEADRKANVVCEATDYVLIEALAWATRWKRRLWELDTTHLSPDSVAEQVVRLVRIRPPSQYGRVDWLADPIVTEHLFL